MPKKKEKTEIAEESPAYFLGLLDRISGEGFFMFAGSKQLIRERVRETGTNNNATECFCIIFVSRHCSFLAMTV